MEHLVAGQAKATACTADVRASANPRYFVNVKRERTVVPNVHSNDAKQEQNQDEEQTPRP